MREWKQYKVSFRTEFPPNTFQPFFLPLICSVAYTTTYVVPSGFLGISFGLWICLFARLFFAFFRSVFHCATAGGFPWAVVED